MPKPSVTESDSSNETGYVRKCRERKGPTSPGQLSRRIVLVTKKQGDWEENRANDVGSRKAPTSFLYHLGEIITPWCRAG